MITQAFRNNVEHTVVSIRFERKPEVINVDQLRKDFETVLKQSIDYWKKY